MSYVRWGLVVVLLLGAAYGMIAAGKQEDSAKSYERDALGQISMMHRDGRTAESTRRLEATISLAERYKHDAERSRYLAGGSVLAAGLLITFPFLRRKLLGRPAEVGADGVPVPSAPVVPTPPAARLGRRLLLVGGVFSLVCLNLLAQTNGQVTLDVLSCSLSTPLALLAGVVVVLFAALHTGPRTGKWHRVRTIGIDLAAAFLLINAVSVLVWSSPSYYTNRNFRPAYGAFLNIVAALMVAAGAALRVSADWRKPEPTA